jgi:hypothetical protein
LSSPALLNHRPRSELQTIDESFSKKFDGDFPDNGHVDFIAATANLSTAAICGFVGLELFKVLSIVPKPIENFQARRINLAQPLISLVEAERCSSQTCTGNRRFFSKWDKWMIKTDLTVDEFRLACERELRMAPSSLLLGKLQIYSSDGPAKISELWARLVAQKLPEGRDAIQIGAIFGEYESDEVKTPDISLGYRYTSILKLSPFEFRPYFSLKAFLQGQKTRKATTIK